MRLPQLSAGVVRDPFTAIGRGLGGIAPRAAVPVCGDPCPAMLRGLACPAECPCALVNGAEICYLAA